MQGLTQVNSKVIKVNNFKKTKAQVKENLQPAPVVDIQQERQDRELHKTGKARCICCGNEFVAVAPVGVHNMECTQCGQMMAFFVYPIQPDTGDLVWRCDNCKCEAFSQIIRNGKHCFWCVGCGVYITPENFLT